MLQFYKVYAYYLKDQVEIMTYLRDIAVYVIISFKDVSAIVSWEETLVLDKMVFVLIHESGCTCLQSYKGHLCYTKSLDKTESPIFDFRSCR